jgi:putative transposase
MRWSVPSSGRLSSPIPAGIGRVPLGIARNSFYFRPRPESAAELEPLKRLDRIFTDHPVYGCRRLQVALVREGGSVGHRASDG